MPVKKHLTVRCLTIFVEHVIIAREYTMTAKPMKALKLHYPTIQFLILHIYSK